MTKNLIVASVTLLFASTVHAQGYREIAAASAAGSGVDLYAADSDAAVQHRSQTDPGGAYASAENLAGTATDIAAIDLADGRREVYIVDDHQTLWQNRRTTGVMADSQDWSGWQQLDNTTRHISVARAESGRTELFTLGDDDALWHTARASDDDAFNGWVKVDLKGTQLAAAAADGDGFLVAVIDNDRSLWLVSFTGAGALAGDPQNVGGESFDVALARLPTGGHSLFTVGTNNDLYEARQRGADQDFGEWKNIGRSAPRVALATAGEGLELFTLDDSGALSVAQLTAADADWSDARSLDETGEAQPAQPLASQLQGRARLIIPSLNVDKDVAVTISLSFSADRTSADITGFPPVVTPPFDTPFGTTTSTVSLARSSTGSLNRDDGSLHLPVTLHFDQSIDLPIIQEDGDLSVELSSDGPDGHALDRSTGEVTLSGKGNFKGQGSPNPVDGEAAQIIVTGKLTPAP